MHFSGDVSTKTRTIQKQLTGGIVLMFGWLDGLGADCRCILRVMFLQRLEQYRKADRWYCISVRLV